MLIALNGAIMVRYHVVVLFPNLSFLNKKCMKNRGVELYSESNCTRVHNTRGAGKFLQKLLNGGFVSVGGISR